MSAYERIREAAAFLREKGASPRALVILGTGLGSLGDRIDDAIRVPYGEIPHFPESTSPSHAGELVFGRLEDVPVAVMLGRFHCYEGYSMEEVTRPVRVARALGAGMLIVTSAVGGLAPVLRLGDVVAVEDHLNLFGSSPLVGPNDDRLGPRFPDMSAPYDPELLEAAETIAIANGFRLPQAVLASVLGPQLETRAEYRFLRRIGADVVGMSTVPETIAAVHAGMRVAAFSVVTDLCFPEALEPIDVDRIIAVANEAAPRLETLVLGLLARMSA